MRGWQVSEPLGDRNVWDRSRLVRILRKARSGTLSRLCAHSEGSMILCTVRLTKKITCLERDHSVA